MYGLIGKMLAVPGERATLMATILESSMAMPGCLSYVVARDQVDENAIWITEVWDNEESHKASLLLPAVQSAIARARPLIAGFGESTTTEPVGSVGLGSPPSPSIPNRSMPPGAIIPELAYPDVDAAAAWLCATFGFRERLRIGNHRRQLTYAGESIIVTAADEPSQGDTRHSIMVRVADVDAHHAHVKKSGAKILGGPETYFFGERQYSVEDVGGHIWTFSQSVTDVAPEAWGGQLVD
jgi:quinol monooxygenase YgiN/uncharacterized glyoxalase superfamily protein PhnB